MRDLIETLTKELEKEDFFLSIKKVSEILYVSKTTILNKIKSGEIKYIKIGKLYKIPKESIICRKKFIERLLTFF